MAANRLADTPPNGPPAVAGLYAAEPDERASDESNASALNTNRWAYRTHNGPEWWGTGPEYVTFESEGDVRCVAIRGRWAERQGSGIITREPANFGFYAMKRRTDGTAPEKHSPWQPAVWMAGQNFASANDSRSIGKRVPVNDEPTNAESLNREHAAPGCWILSTKDQFENTRNRWHFRNGLDESLFLFADSSLDIDYFRHFPLINQTQARWTAGT